MKEEIEKLTQQLIQADTTSNSMKAAMILEDFLENYGYEVDLIEYNDKNTNLLVEIGPKNTPGFLISGHMDTVPLGELEKWSHDPLSGKIINGEIWGRGSVDMKGGTASLAGVMAELIPFESQLSQRVVFAATDQEEIGLIGAREFVKRGKIKNLSHILIAEPTGLEPKIMEKGIIWFHIHGFGKQAHASRPDLGSNAIEAVSKLFPKIHEILPKKSLPDLGKTTFNVGLIKGGTAANVVAEKVKVTCDIRTTPGIKNSDVIESIKKFLEENSNEVKFDMEIFENTPAILSPDNSLADLLAKKTEQYTGIKPEFGGVHYASDGAIFMDAVDNTIPFVIYGPGSTELLHQTNERLKLKELDLSRQIIRETIIEIVI